jgi:hypothetical protein
MGAPAVSVAVTQLAQLVRCALPAP